MKSFLVTNALVHSDNKGCVALTYSVLYLLDRILRDNGIAYKFYLPESALKDGRYDIDILGSKIEFIVIRNASIHSLFDFLRMLRHPIKYLNTLKVYKNADLVLDLGQGDSFSDIYGIERFEQIILEYRLADFFRIPYCIMPQTIGPYSNKKVLKKAIEIISKAKMVMTRDTQSFEYVNKILPDKPLCSLIDVAFFMPYKRIMFHDECIHVGLNISALLWHGGYTQNNQFSLTIDYKTLVYRIIDFFLTQDNIKLHLVAHVVGGQRHIENDYAVACDIYNYYQTDKMVLSPMFFDPISAKNYIAALDFFVGARMHATIAAFSSNVPVFPLAYSRKFNGLFIDTLGYDYMGDMKKQSAEELMIALEKAYTNRLNLKKQIEFIMQTKVQDLRKELMQNLQNLVCSIK